MQDEQTKSNAASQEDLLDRPLEVVIAPTHEGADAFWKYWEQNGKTHRHGYYESTWGAINAALRLAGVRIRITAAPES